MTAFGSAGFFLWVCIVKFRFVGFGGSFSFTFITCVFVRLGRVERLVWSVRSRFKFRFGLVYLRSVISISITRSKFRLGAVRAAVVMVLELRGAKG